MVDASIDEGIFMRIRSVAISFVLFTLCVTYTASTTQASELIVKDCEGITRAVEKTELNSTSTLTVQVNNENGTPLNGVQVQLTNMLTQAKKTTVAKDGSASFTEVTAGIWTICDSNSNVQMTKVTIESNKADGVNQALAVGGGLAAAAGLAIGVSAGSDDSGDESTRARLGEPSGSGTETGGAPTAGSALSDSSKTSAANNKKPNSSGIRPLEGEECGTDEEPDPVSPFS